MFEKFRNIFQKDRKIENLVFLLILLILTLICINWVMKDDSKKENKNKYAGAVLASTDNSVDMNLEARIENILGKMNGVGKVSVLLTYDSEKLEGIVIVAEGVNKLEIKADIISAVEALTGLGKHKIKVYEMKNLKNEGGDYGKENQYGES